MKQCLHKCILIGALVSINACKENVSDTDNKATNNFVFRVIVKNADGLPVQGVRVSAYNDPTQSGLSKKQNGEETHNVSSVSTVNFALSTFGRTTLTLLELDGKILQQPLLNDRLNAGMYAVSISLNYNVAGTRVYKAILRVVNDTTNAEIYNDSIYITLWQPDPSMAVLGYTSSSGVFELHDSLTFPNVLALPPMIKTNETGPDSVGTFVIPNDVVITLYDTLSQKYESFFTQVHKGKNEFVLTWNPSPNAMLSKPYPLRPFYISKTDTVRKDSIFISETQLFQNYPNPFN